MNSTSRRQFLGLLGATGLSAAIPSSAFAALAPPQESFTFLFVTDTHLQPELNGVIGTDMAFKKARTIKADFAINGGDHVFDALAVPTKRPCSSVANAKAEEVKTPAVVNTNVRVLICGNMELNGKQAVFVTLPRFKASVGTSKSNDASNACPIIS